MVKACFLLTYSLRSVFLNLALIQGKPKVHKILDRIGEFSFIKCVWWTVLRFWIRDTSRPIFFRPLTSTPWKRTITLDFDLIEIRKKDRKISQKSWKKSLRILDDWGGCPHSDEVPQRQARQRSVYRVAFRFSSRS